LLQSYQLAMQMQKREVVYPYPHGIKIDHLTGIQ
jgi:hypothetical protein